MKVPIWAIENLPSGPVNVGQDERAILPDKGAVYTTIEGLISQFEVVMWNRGFTVPCEELYCPTEAPNGELGFYIVGDGSRRQDTGSQHGVDQPRVHHVGHSHRAFSPGPIDPSPDNLI